MTNTITLPAAHWIEQLDHTQYDIDLIKNACIFAQHNEKTLAQGLAMADVLLSLQCDSDAITAAIIYPTVFDDQHLLSSLTTQFNKTICKLIHGALQMEIIHSVRTEKNEVSEKRKETAQQNQIDNLRKMMLAMVDDIRTILLKLSERLILLQHCDQSTPTEQKQIAQDTFDYYAPLANRLGIGHLKWQLEDWAFRYINSKEYHAISNAVHMQGEDRIQLIHAMVTELKNVLKKGDIRDATVSGRVKHIYSIYKKIQRKQVSFESIYDTNAIRILVPTITDCYTALSLVHAKWPPITEEFDDYIAKPKPNGYQSIHTAITRDNHIPVEIQIRTFDMHEKAELGIAAHWKYKENRSVHETDEQKILLLRELLDWQKNTMQIEDAHKKTHLYRDAFHNRVYVFSPNGDVFDLPAGATPLDFAYLIHTEIGHRCRGAKINNALVSLTHTLQTGERIDIMTAKEGHPSRDWMRPALGFLKTPHAIRKVKNWFYKQDFQQNMDTGLLVWEKIARQQEWSKNDIEKIATLFHFKTADMLLAALGSGEISPAAITHKLDELNSKPTSVAHLIDDSSEKKPTLSSTDFSVLGTTHLLTQLARCCHPIPGDSIMGYITQGRGISVHQKNCRNIKIAESTKPERLIEILWENQGKKNYHVNLTIQCNDRAHLLRDVTAVISQLNLSIVSLNTHTSQQNRSAIISLTLEVNNIELLDEIVKKMKQVQGVVSVKRS